MANKLQSWVEEILLKYFVEEKIEGELRVSSFNEHPIDSGKDGKGEYCLVFLFGPHMRSYEVYKSGEVVDLGCDYEGRWDGMG